MNLTNNTILITGGGSGIGLALAKQFLKHGNKVIISGRNIERLKNAKRENPALEIIQCDVSNEESVQALVQDIQQKYPDLNFLINNAGMMRMYNIQKKSTDIQEQKNEIMTNLFGPVQCSQTLIPQLLKQKNSAILNVSTAAAISPIAAMPIYCATKAALHSYTVSIREQLQNTSIKVFELVPAGTDTDMAAGMPGPKMAPDELAILTINGLKNDTYEIRPGMVKMMYMMNRFFPSLPKQILGKISNELLAKL